MKLTVNNQRGFTLIELMVTLVIAMVILGGLLLNFTSQATQYKYQNKRGDAVQDLEFTLHFIARDIQEALISTTSLEVTGVGTPSVKFDGAGKLPTTWLSVNVWDQLTTNPTFNAALTANNMQAVRCYRYRGAVGSAATKWKLYFKSLDANCSPTLPLSGFDALLGEVQGMRVTHFRVFRDGAVGDGRGNYTGVPLALLGKELTDAKGIKFTVPAFTILVEIEIDAANKGSTVDV
ncbi:MAG: prepilin-type N-terminal cleavage/methylation domain-containing protein, partial [Ghiorsea sp.]|nr:prepilin-type N-terminal cleavage/methylation domain-containing protein [Ghiorsea sp.]